MDLGLSIMAAKYAMMERAETPAGRMLAHDAANLAMVLVAIVAGVVKNVKMGVN